MDNNDREPLNGEGQGYFIFLFVHLFGVSTAALCLLDKYPPLEPHPQLFSFYFQMLGSQLKILLPPPPK